MPGKVEWQRSHDAPVRMANIGMACAGSGFMNPTAHTQAEMLDINVNRTPITRTPRSSENLIMYFASPPKHARVCAQVGFSSTTSNAVLAMYVGGKPLTPRVAVEAGWRSEERAAPVERPSRECDNAAARRTRVAGTAVVGRPAKSSRGFAIPRERPRARSRRPAIRWRARKARGLESQRRAARPV